MSITDRYPLPKKFQRPRPPAVDHYFDRLNYRGRSSAMIELSFDKPLGRRVRWWARFTVSRWEFGPFGNKIAALIFMAHRCGRSGRDMQWEAT